MGRRRRRCLYQEDAHDSCLPTTSRIHMKRLQITQSKALKLVLNKQWYTSTNEIHEMANIPRIDEYIQKLTENVESKLA
jgi:hypothetical protein